MLIIPPGADFSGRTRLPIAQPLGGLLIFANLTGGVEATARNPEYGEMEELSKAGTPLFTKWGARVSATDYLGTTLNANTDYNAANVSIAGVFFRKPTSMYFGNFANTDPNDSLLESSAGETRYRYVSTAPANVNVDVFNPAPVGAPFFFAAAASPDGAVAMVGYGGRTYFKESAVARAHTGTLAVRIGSGSGNTFTTGSFIASAVALWERTLALNEMQEFYHFLRNYKMAKPRVHC